MNNSLDQLEAEILNILVYLFVVVVVPGIIYKIIRAFQKRKKFKISEQDSDTIAKLKDDPRTQIKIERYARLEAFLGIALWLAIGWFSLVFVVTSVDAKVLSAVLFMLAFFAGLGPAWFLAMAVTKLACRIISPDLDANLLNVYMIGGLKKENPYNLEKIALKMKFDYPKFNFKLARMLTYFYATILLVVLLSRFT